MSEWWQKALKYDFFDKDRAFEKYMRMFLRITNRMFKWTGLPDHIPVNILELWLQTHGVLCFTEYEGKVYPFFGGYGGTQDIYYNPATFVIANPAAPGIGEVRIRNLDVPTVQAKFPAQEGIVIWNDSQKQGLVELFKKYAKLLLENDISIYDAEINLRIQTLIHAADDRTKASAEQYLKRIEEGKLGIIAGKSLDPTTALATKPFVSGGNSNALSQLIEMHQYLKASLLNELGLNANYNMKRERINSAETELNNDGLLPLVDDMLACRKKAAEALNDFFGWEVEVEKASAWEFRQLAAEVDAMNPEGIIPDEEQNDAAPEEPEAAAEESQEETEEAPDQETEEAPEEETEEKEEKDDVTERDETD